jgi:hypothetical protein
MAEILGAFKVLLSLAARIVSLHIAHQLQEFGAAEGQTTFRNRKIQSDLPTLYKRGTLVLQHAMLFPVEILPLILLRAFLHPFAIRKDWIIALHNPAVFLPE